MIVGPGQENAGSRAANASNLGPMHIREIRIPKSRLGQINKEQRVTSVHKPLEPSSTRLAQEHTQQQAPTAHEHNLSLDHNTEVAADDSDATEIGRDQSIRSDEKPKEEICEDFMGELMELKKEVSTLLKKTNDMFGLLKADESNKPPAAAITDQTPQTVAPKPKPTFLAAFDLPETEIRGADGLTFRQKAAVKFMDEYIRPQEASIDVLDDW